MSEDGFHNVGVPSKFLLIAGHAHIHFSIHFHPI
jgi:hypothetical protein